MSRARWRLAGSVLAALLAAATASAHEARPAYLEIKETAAGKYDLLWRTPVLSGMRLPVVLKIPDDVRNVKEPRVQELADSLVERRWVDAGPDGLAGKRIQFVGLQLTITDVLVHVETRDGRTWTAIAHPSEPWVEIARPQGPLAVIHNYVLHGIRHIAFGADHLLLLLGLALIVKERKRLLKSVTALVVANSLTLALATLGYANVPVVPLNAALALSILYLGLEAARSQRGESSFAIRHPSAVAFVFGLLLGFGLASALPSAGLPRTELPLALLSFNAGVELAQVAFVLLVVLLAWWFRRLEIRWPLMAKALPTYAVGSLGAFWVIQRTAILLGIVRTVR